MIASARSSAWATTCRAGAGATLVLALYLSSSALAAPPSPDSPAVEAERDALLDKLARGVDYEASLRRYVELVRARDAVIATTEAAQQRERAEQLRRHDWLTAYRETLDSQLAQRCTLSPDPAHPLPSTEGRFRADWGRVLRKQQVRYAGKNALDEGELATLYEVAGVGRRYVLRGERFDASGRGKLEAEVGQLLLVCAGQESVEPRLPHGWGDRVLRSGFAARIKAPPRIVDKARWAPSHVTESALYFAVREARWLLPGPNLLVHGEVRRDLGNGRYEIAATSQLAWILEVPPGLRHAELLVPGQSAWILAGQHRFDPALKRLVLTALDLEGRYVESE